MIYDRDKYYCNSTYDTNTFFATSTHVTSTAQINPFISQRAKSNSLFGRVMYHSNNKTLKVNGS